MDIVFSSNSLRNMCTVFEKARKKLGDPRAELLFRRLQEMSAVSNMNELHTLRHLKMHKLAGNRKGKWSIKLDGGYRVVFEPFSEGAGPLERLSDGTVDLQKVTCVQVTEVEDYHD